ncbi:hypothetical protein [Aquimarina aquimarini]|uniref:hypothetical protein n=1 Tax=Aquimarina aquimarini TaxID=1191734 RepID=UPI001F3E2A00|nr:hypothetical protein [Aquimarina aquimarini]
MALFIIAIILLFVGFLSIRPKIKEEVAYKKFERFLLSLPKFKIPLDTVKVDGFHWRESIPVDIYDNELDPNDPYFYGRSKYSYSNKYHKDKAVTKFKSSVYITIPYEGLGHKIKLYIPIEHTVINMKFYLEKELPIYVEKVKDEDMTEYFRFFLDFRFLESPHISIIATEFLEKKR